MFSGNGPSNGPNAGDDELKLPAREAVSETPAKVVGAIGKGTQATTLPIDIETLGRAYEQKFGRTLQDSRHGTLELLARLEVELQIGVAELKEAQAAVPRSNQVVSLEKAVTVLMNFYEHTEQHLKQVDVVTHLWGTLCQLAVQRHATGGADTSLRLAEATAKYQNEVAKLTPEVTLQLSIDDPVTRERLLGRAMKEFGGGDGLSAT